jgi:WS/DGAT/MGAT family acyltransferase
MKQLSWTDAALVRLESATAPLHVNPILIYDQSTVPDGRVSFKDILRAIEDRLHLAPSFRRRLASAPGGLIAPFWVEDENFDLEYHVRHIALPKPGDWRQFCIQVARLHARPLDLSRPPWELTVIEGLDNIEGLPKGCFAISLKVHHAAIDGVEGVALITAIHDLAAAGDHSRENGAWRAESAPGPLSLLGRTAGSAVRYPVQAAQVIGRAAPAGLRVLARELRARRRPRGLPVPRTRFNGAVSSHRVFEARFHDFEDVRRIKSAVPGATVNDVALAYVGGALRHYLDAHGELPEASLVAVCPVSVRTPDQVGSGGNMISGMRVAVRSDVADPLERLAAITAVTSVDRVRRQAVSATTLLDVAELLPGALLGIGSRAGALIVRGPQVANTTVTNVPSSRVPLYFAGAKLVRSTGNGPVFHGVGLIHLVSTYVGDFSCAITADRDLLPDPAFYAECMQRSFDELLAAVTPPRPSGRKRVTKTGT